MEVQTAAFERFQKLFDKYSEEVRKQPEIWKKINAEHEKLAGGFADFGNKMDAHVSALEDLKDAQEEQDKSLTHSRSMWSDIEKSSRNTTKSILSGTTSLLKWTGLLSGIGGVLGYFSLRGMMGMGQEVFGFRKSAMGLGVSTGQQRAFDISFGRLLGSPQGFLGGISSAVSDLSQQGPLYALGVNPNGSTSQVAVSTLQALRAKAVGTPTNQLGILEQMYQLGNLGIGVDDLRRLKTMSAPEFGQLLGTYRRQQSALGLTDQTAKTWTDFITKMDLAKARLDNVFVKGLERLAGPVSNLATGLTHVVEVVMSKNGGIDKDINGIADWMEKFNGKITKPEFLTNVGRFVDLVGSMAAKANDIADLYNFVQPSSGPWSTSGGLGGALFKGGAWAYGNAPFWWSDIKSFFTPGVSARYVVGQRLKWTQAANKMDPSGLLGLVGWLGSGMNPSAGKSSNGGLGMMGMLPDVAASLGVDPSNPSQALSGAQIELQHLVREYNGHLNKVFAAYAWGEGNLNRDIAQHPNDWQRYLPSETTNYLTRAIKAILAGAVKVDIQNSTGGSAAASASGLGAQR